MGVTALGGWALGLAFVVAGASAVASGDGARRGRPSSVDWGRRGLVAVFGLASVGLVALAWALVTEDYSLVYVADNASRDTTWPYRLAGLWGGMSGSLLLWTWMLAGWSLLASRSVRRRRPELAGGTQAVLALEAAVFLGLLVTVSRPFATLAVPAIDGGGLTPILRHPAMLYHPPLLYAGYVGLAVPAAIAVAALTSAAGAARDWIGVARRFMVPSLVLLAVGLTAGAHWAYVELGWGGYWAWDPVENGALLPWLAGIAFLHSALLATRRPGLWPEPVAGRLPRAKDPAASPPLDGLWRESVAGRPLRAKDAAAHPALDGLGRETGASRPRRDTDAGAGPAGDGLWRETGASRPPRDKDAGAGPVADGLSRETGATRPQRDKDRDGGGLAAAGLAFLAFGLSLLGAFLTRSGVTASVHAFAEARAVGRVLLAAVAVTSIVLAGLTLTRRRQQHQPPPLPVTALTTEGAVRANNGLLLATIVVVGFGLLFPVVSGDDLVVTGRYFAVVTAPLAMGLLAAIGVGPRLGWRPRPWPDIRHRLRPAGLGIAALATAAITLDDRRPVPLAIIGLAGSAAALTIAEIRQRPTRRAMGGLLAHLGVVVLLAGVAGTATGTHATASLVPGQSVAVRGHTVHLDRVEPVTAPDGGRAARAVLTVDGRTLRPVALVAASGDRVSEAALHSTPVRDIQLALRTVSSGGEAIVVEIFVVPLAQWVWWGALLMAAGIGLSLRRQLHGGAVPGRPVEGVLGRPAPVGRGAARSAPPLMPG